MPIDELSDGDIAGAVDRPQIGLTVPVNVEHLSLTSTLSGQFGLVHSLQAAALGHREVEYAGIVER